MMSTSEMPGPSITVLRSLREGDSLEVEANPRSQG